MLTFTPFAQQDRPRREIELARLGAQLQALVGEDASPCFTTDELGQILYRNVAAMGRFG